MFRSGLTLTADIQYCLAFKQHGLEGRGVGKAGGPERVLLVGLDVAATIEFCTQLEKKIVSLRLPPSVPVRDPSEMNFLIAWQRPHISYYIRYAWLANLAPVQKCTF
jgi:hypothetical protein